MTRRGEGNRSPLQCSCLENSVDRGAWWAAAHGVAQSRTRLKWLSMHACMHWRRQWHPTLVLLPGESQGRGSLVGCLPSMGSHRVGHDWSDLAAAAVSWRGVGDISGLWWYSVSHMFITWARSVGKNLSSCTLLKCALLSVIYSNNISFIISVDTQTLGSCQGSYYYVSIL